jgi:hypothetical protein
MDEFKAELRKLHKYASTWVTFLWTSCYMYWMQLSHDTQQQILSSYGLLRYAPAVAFATFLIARAMPQAQKDTPKE